MIKELNWDEDEIYQFVETVNKVFNKRTIQTRSVMGNEEPDNSLVVHPATYSGGFILFGGWTKIFDSKIPAGTRGHELYLAFGGLGVGGWNGDCDIELITEGTFVHEGKTYNKPVHFYDEGKDKEWESYNSGFKWFHDNVKSFMFMYLPIFAQPIPVFAYFDKNNVRIGVSVPNSSLSIGIGGGTVKVEG